MTLFSTVEFCLLDKDGNEFSLEHPTRHLTGLSGIGMPPIAHFETRGPFQDGTTHWNYAVMARTVNMAFLTTACGRDELWERRRENIDMLSPRRSPHQLRLTQPNGEQYLLKELWYQGGYELEQNDLDYPYAVMGGAQWRAGDPFWKWTTAPLDSGETRNASGQTCKQSSTFTLSDQLAIPFTPPFLLGTTTATLTLTCTNDGTWAVQPTITVTGPVEDWTLTNPANGYALEWNGYVIAAGEVVTIDIKAKTATNAAGTDLRNYLSGDTARFCLEPGANALAFWASGGVVNATTTVSCCWYVEVLGT